MMTTDAPELFIYQEDETIPPHFYYQAQSFVRIFWSDGDDRDIESGLNEPAIHLVLAKGKSLLSYATIVQRDVNIEGQLYKMAGLGNVMTFPYFRKRGYGGQVVQAATKIIQSKTSVDFGLLWTEPKNYDFYRRSGWELTPDLVTLLGDPQNPHPYEDEEGMVLFCSDKARQERASITSGHIYIGVGKW